MTRMNVKSREVFTVNADRFAAISSIFRLRNAIALEASFKNLYTQTAVLAFSAASRACYLRTKGVPVSNTFISYMKDEADIEGFLSAFAGSFTEKAAVRVSVSEGYNGTTRLVPESHLSGMAELLMDSIKAQREDESTHYTSGFAAENIVFKPCVPAVELSEALKNHVFDFAKMFV